MALSRVIVPADEMLRIFRTRSFADPEGKSCGFSFAAFRARRAVVKTELFLGGVFVLE